MLAKQPERRYATPEQLIAELTALASSYGLEAASSSRLVWPSPVELQYTIWERHLPWIAPLAALLLLVAILGFIWSRDDGLDTPPPIVPAAGAVEPAAREDNASTKGESNAASKSAELSTEPDRVAAQPQADDRPSSKQGTEPSR